jgi:uncharacterized membrane protein (UPF0182 family)
MSRRQVAGLAVVAVLVLLFGGRWLAVRYTEHAWYAELGQASRWWTLLWQTLAWQALVLTGATAWYAAHTLGVYRSIGSVHLPRRLGNLEIAEEVPRRALRATALAIALLLGAVTAYSFANLDHLAALWRHAVPLGWVEPVLGRDASFYMTRLPLLEQLHLLALLSVLLAGALVVGLYALTGSLTLQGRKLRLTPHARTHLVILLCALALAIAWGFHLDALQLVGGGGGADGALTAVDRSVRVPAANALAGIALVVAIGTALALRWVRAGVLFGLWATLAAAAFLGRFLVPVMADAWGGGNPAVAQAMAGYADGFTRAGIGLLEVRTRTQLVAGSMDADSAEAVGAQLAGLSVWHGEGALLEAAVAAARGDSAPARIWSATLDVYRDSSGAERLVWVLVPQTDALGAARLVPRPRWAETHRERLAWAGEPSAVDAAAGASGLRFYARLEPARIAPGPVALEGVAPRLRFPPRPVDLAVVGPDEGAVGAPAPGLLLGGFARRLLLAWALQAPPLMDDHTSSADRVLVWRDVPTRLARLFRFASFDAPRAVVSGGRLFWVTDGYLASSRFPLAHRVRWNGEPVNYLAPAYLATVDAETGRTRLYLRAPGHPFAVSVARADGVDPEPADSFPAGLVGHLVYPRGLLVVQAAAIARRGGADGAPGPRPWTLAWPDTATAGADLASLLPSAGLFALDGGPRRLWSLLPLTDGPANRLAALVAGATDGRGAPSLLVLQLAGDDAPPPAMAASRLASAPAVLGAVAASAGPEGATRRGPVTAVPAGGTVAYAQPLFASANRATQPMQLVAVALSAGGRVGVGESFGPAARALTRPEATAGGPEVTASLSEARSAFQALDSAVRAGDWARFGRAYEALRRALGVEGPRP